MKSERLGFGNLALDDLVGGGLEPKVITQIFGEPASGKSTICIMAAVTCLKSGKGVIFLDSEGFSIERFRQVAGSEAHELARNLYIFEPEDFDQQGVMIGSMETVLKREAIGLIIMDSATGLYRTRLDKGKEAMQKLTRQMIHLLGYAKRYGIPVLITNQVYMDMKKNTFTGLGGTALEHISKAILKTTRLNSHRRCELVKHRSMAAGLSLDFSIIDSGIQITD